MRDDCILRKCFHGHIRFASAIQNISLFRACLFKSEFCSDETLQ